MEIRFWGVRGSIASPGPKTTYFGGNTSCLEIHTGDKSLILDAGTGIRLLGNTLSQPEGAKALTLHLLLSHFHTDHICGLPFFHPLYEKNTTLHIYGPRENHRQPGAVLNAFFAEEFFPVPISRMPARLQFHALANDRVKIGPFQITTFVVNHPGTALGYRIESAGKKLVYLSDHEPMEKYCHLKHTTRLHYEQSLLQALQGADLLIHDAHFTDSRYPRFRGWGHSPWSYPVALAAAAGIKKLVLFHYAPEYDDSQLKRSFAQLKQQMRREKSPVQVLMAREGDSHYC